MSNITYLYSKQSTLNSLKNFKFAWDGSVPKVGDVIHLVNMITGKKKRFEIERIKKLKRGFMFQNMNNTIVLKK